MTDVSAVICSRFLMRKRFFLRLREITEKSVEGYPGDDYSAVLDGEGPNRNAQSLHVTGVCFRADKRLVRQLDLRCKLEKGAVSRIRRSRYTEAQRLEKAREFLRKHTVMRLGDYYRLVGLSRTTASLELRKWERNPATGITSEGSYATKVYLLRPMD